MNDIRRKLLHAGGLIAAAALATACAGETGDIGKAGAAGPQGETGERGPQGWRGETGERGARGENGVKGEKGDRGEQGPVGLMALVRTSPDAPAELCPTGGLRVESGVDANRDGVLGDEEVDSEAVRFVCHGAVGAQGPQGLQGATGETGLAALVRLETLAAGAECSTGGTRIESGIDANGDGALAAEEVDTAATAFVCNGEVGAQGPQGDPGLQGIQGVQGETGPQGLPGADGLSTLARTAAEPAGANCATGGIRVETGLDANRDAILGDAEVNAALTRYVCNGATGAQGLQGPAGAQGVPGTDGFRALVEVTDEMAGGNCAAGGVRVVSGTDFDGNGVLAGVVETDTATTRFVCHGAQGVQGIAGIQGPQGEVGPQGPQGLAGATGPAGPEGPQGPQGLAGATGPAGPQGPTGATGPQGPMGPAGGTALYGDGSAGTFQPQASLDLGTDAGVAALPGGPNLQFTNIHVPTGVTLTVPSGTILRATGNVVIAGNLVVRPGAMGGDYPVPGISRGMPGFFGGVGVGRLEAAHLGLPRFGGGPGARDWSGNNTGGDGGGSVIIAAQGTVVVTGSIRADGTNSTNPTVPGVGANGGGGGGGGVVIVASKSSISVHAGGTISVRGGNGSNGWDGNGGDGEGGGGGGGGGLVHLIAPAPAAVSGAIHVNGGVGGVPGGAVNQWQGWGYGGGASVGAGGSGSQPGVASQSGGSGLLLVSTLPAPENLLSR